LHLDLPIVALEGFNLDMDIGSISSSLASQATASGSLNVSLLSAVNNLDQDVANRLFASIGIGANVNSLA